jgi:IPT/TIG domain
LKNLVSEGGGGDALETLTANLQWQGAYSLVANPLASSLPIVASLSPAGGGTAGGTLVTIKGSRLTGATVVKFGATNATSFTVVDDTRVVAVAPAGAAGSVQVAVTTSGGSSANTAADDYLYA